jgi:NTE family protein
MGNRALVLSGGGAKGAFELGVVDYLVKDLGIAFEVICGVSTGALNASFLSQGKGLDGLRERLEALKEIWFSITSDDDIYHDSLTWDFPRIVSLYNNRPLREKIETLIDPALIRESGTEFRIGVVSLNSGEYLSIDQSATALKRFILASTAIPVLFSPVKYKGNLYVDGGVRNITPLQDALKALKGLPQRESPDDVYLVLASPIAIRRVPASDTDNILEILKRSVEILTAEVYREDIEHAVEVNEYISGIERLRARLSGHLSREETEEIMAEARLPFSKKSQRYVNIFMFEPEKEYLGSLEFDPAKIRKAFRAGREKAREVMSSP